MGCFEQHFDRKWSLTGTRTRHFLPTLEVSVCPLETNFNTILQGTKCPQLQQEGHAASIACPKESQIDVVKLAPRDFCNIKVTKQNLRCNIGATKNFGNKVSSRSEGQVVWICGEVRAGQPAMVTHRRAVPVGLHVKAFSKVFPVPSHFCHNEFRTSSWGCLVVCNVQAVNTFSKNRTEGLEANRRAQFKNCHNPPGISCRTRAKQRTGYNDRYALIHLIVVLAVVPKKFERQAVRRFLKKSPWDIVGLCTGPKIRNYL